MHIFLSPTCLSQLTKITDRLCLLIHQFLLVLHIFKFASQIKSHSHLIPRFSSISFTFLAVLKRNSPSSYKGRHGVLNASFPWLETVGVCSQPLGVIFHSMKIHLQPETSNLPVQTAFLENARKESEQHSIFQLILLTIPQVTFRASVLSLCLSPVPQRQCIL